MKRVRTTGPFSRVGATPLPCYAQTALNAGLLRRIVVSLSAVAAFLALAAPGHAAQPRVLAIHFDTEVNPVTQSYLSDQLKHAAKDGYAPP